MTTQATNIKRIWTRLLLAAFVIAAAFIAAPRYASAESDSAACYMVYGSNYHYLYDSDVALCINNLFAGAPAASDGFTYGMWDNLEFAIAANGALYLFDGTSWQLYDGFVATGRTSGTLSQRCMNGDTAACNQWSNQTDWASESLDYLHGQSWVDSFGLMGQDYSGGE